MDEEKFWDDLAASRRPDDEEEKFWSGLSSSPYSQQDYKSESDADDWQITKGVKQNYQQLEGIGGGSIGLIGELIGNDRIRDAGYAAYLRNMDQANKYVGDTPSFTDITDLDSAADYVLHGLGTTLPMLLPSLITGGIGAQVGRKIATSAIEKRAAALISKGVAQDQALKQAAKEIGTKAITAGSATGAFAGSMGMQSGMIYGDVREETGESRPDVALGFGAILGAFDAVPIFKVLDRLGFGKRVKEGAAEQVKEALSTFIGKQMLAEGGTEMLQTIGEQAAIAWVDANREMFTDEDWEEIVNAGLIGAIGGGALGSIGGRGTEQPAQEDPKMESQTVDDFGNPIPPENQVPVPDAPETGGEPLPEATPEQLDALVPPEPAEPLQQEVDELFKDVPIPPGADALDVEASRPSPEQTELFPATEPLDEVLQTPVPDVAEPAADTEPTQEEPQPTQEELDLSATETDAEPAQETVETPEPAETEVTTGAESNPLTIVDDDTDTYATSADGAIEVRLKPESLQEDVVTYDVLRDGKVVANGKALPLNDAMSLGNKLAGNTVSEVKSETAPTITTKRIGAKKAREEFGEFYGGTVASRGDERLFVQKVPGTGGGIFVAQDRSKFSKTTPIKLPVDTVKSAIEYLGENWSTYYGKTSGAWNVIDDATPVADAVPQKVDLKDIVIDLPAIKKDGSKTTITGPAKKWVEMQPEKANTVEKLLRCLYA